MGLFRKKKDLTYDGVPGTAVVTDAEDARFFDSDDTTSLADLGIGTVRYRFTLEVTLDDGRAPYVVDAKFKVPAKLEGELSKGATVPVYADPDDPQRVEINWEGWIASGGGQPTPMDVADTRQLVYDSMPEASRRMMIDGWVAAAKAGALSGEEVEQAIADAVTSGMVNDEEAAAARAQLG